MQRTEAETHIRELIGQDLRALADKLDVTVRNERGNLNKGWAGHTIEHYLGLPINSAQAPNFGSWELKVVPLALNSRGQLQPKETMAITMIDPFEVERKEFQDSHLFIKLRKMLVVSRVYESRAETRSLVHGVASFDLDDPETYDIVKSDYDLVRSAIVERGFDSLTGRMGRFIQPRTKGAGHGSRTRAFYARKPFVAMILEI